MSSVMDQLFTDFSDDLSKLSSKFVALQTTFKAQRTAVSASLQRVKAVAAGEDAQESKPHAAVDQGQFSKSWPSDVPSLCASSASAHNTAAAALGTVHHGRNHSMPGLEVTILGVIQAQTVSSRNVPHMI